MRFIQLFFTWHVTWNTILSLISMNRHGFGQEDHQGTLVQKVRSGSESSGASCSKVIWSDFGSDWIKSWKWCSEEEKGFWIRIRSQNPILVLIWINSSVCVVQKVLVRFWCFWSKKQDYSDPGRRGDFRNKNLIKAAAIYTKCKYHIFLH